MAKPLCFCGCRSEIPKFPLGMRSLNKGGRNVKDRLEYTRLLLGDEDPDHLADWLDEGDLWVNVIAAAMHRDIPPASVSAQDKSAIADWLSFGRKIQKSASGGLSFPHWLATGKPGVQKVERPLEELDWLEERGWPTTR